MSDEAASTKHPKGLYLLFTVEMWERMSYYGMRALLVLYMVSKTTDANPGFGFAKPDALSIYAWYTGLVYATPVIGGYLSDKFIGQRRAVYIGGTLMMIGHFLMAAPGKVPFFIALLFLIIGNGFFKPNISTMVGGLYEEDDPRRDGAFTIFYMGINLGAFLSGIVCGTLGEKVSYHWGFASAGVGMALGLVFFWLGEKRLLPDHVGQKPDPSKAADTDKTEPKKPFTREEIDRIAVILVLAIFVMFFWAAFEQAGGLMNIYTKEKVDRFIGGWEVPATWFQSVNPAIIFLFAPLFSWLWTYLGRKKLDPPTPIKMAFGLLLLSFGFIFMLHAVNQADAGNSGLAALMWVVGAYFWHTMGELCLSPIGLSMVTKLAPARIVSLMMGVWFFSNFLANLAAGYIGGFSEQLGEYTLFSYIVFGTAGAGMLLFFLARPLVKWMHMPAEGDAWGWPVLIGSAVLAGLFFVGYPQVLKSARADEAFKCHWDQREAKANLYKLRDKQRAYFAGTAEGQDDVPAADRKMRATFSDDMGKIGFCPIPDRIDHSQRGTIHQLESLFGRQSKYKKDNKRFATLEELKIDLAKWNKDSDYEYSYTAGEGTFRLEAKRVKPAPKADNGHDLTGDTWTIDEKGCLLNPTGILYSYRIVKADAQGFVAEAKRIDGRGREGDTWTLKDTTANFTAEYSALQKMFGTYNQRVISSNSYGDLQGVADTCPAR